MKKPIFIFILLFCFSTVYGQQYDKSCSCGTDTVFISHSFRTKYEKREYKAFRCTQVAKLGFRMEVGFNSYIYNERTKNWLGNHHAALFGFWAVYKQFNLGVLFELATVSPKMELNFQGEALTRDAKLNPVKIDYAIGYSLDLKYNISIEPFGAVTSNIFHVINEEELNRNYEIPGIWGMTAGVTVNKYIPLKDFAFISIFARYGYGFTDFRKVHSGLGSGYSDICFGVAWKKFGRHFFLKEIK